MSTTSRGILLKPCAQVESSPPPHPHSRAGRLQHTSPKCKPYPPFHAQRTPFLGTLLRACNHHRFLPDQFPRSCYLPPKLPRLQALGPRPCLRKPSLPITAPTVG